MDMNHGDKIITPASALRRIPTYVSSKDKVVLDGIRYFIEIADRAYRRLRETLMAVSSQSDDDHVEFYVDMVADAWTIVDSIHRLRVMCEANCSLLNKDHSAEYADFTMDVVLLRNSIQHMHRKLEKLVADKESAWGVLSWTVCTENPPTRAEKHSFSAGTMRANDIEMGGFPERPFYPPVHGITLRAAKTTISLSDFMIVTRQFAAAIDENLKRSCPVDAPHVRDAHATAHCVFNSTGIPAGNIKIVFKQAVSPQLNRGQRRLKR